MSGPQGRRGEDLADGQADGSSREELDAGSSGEIAGDVRDTGPGAARITEEQHRREKSQRDAALGKRLRAIQSGQYGAVLRRWVNGAVEPVAARIRLASQAYLGRDYFLFASVLDSPIFELSASAHGSSSDLAPILKWCCKGSSPGRLALETTYADDLVLTVLGQALLHLCEREGSAPLTALLSSCGAAARECAIGQFLTSVQGAETLEQIRRRNPQSWQQLQKMQSATGLLLGQVQGALRAAQRGEIQLEKFGSRSILEVTDHGKQRRLSVRPPEADDWDLLRIAHQPKGTEDRNREAWISFALVVLTAAQVEQGWFDITEGKRTKRNYRGAHRLTFSEQAYRYIAADIEKWLSLGFTRDPMLTRPVSGDYLTVKHDPVTGKRGPMGIRTDIEKTTHWKTACEVLAGTAWTVNTELLKSLPADLGLAACDNDFSKYQAIVAAHKREAKNTFYLPIYADFRGRLYPQTSFVSYQGNDLQKALLCFPEEGSPQPEDIPEGYGIPVILHCSSLYGGPAKLDKQTLNIRMEWFSTLSSRIRDKDELSFMLQQADEPLQFLAAVKLLSVGSWNRIPIQMDGTCNGLQHLSAMFRDEQAAPYVNLTASTWEDKPSDIYGVVAEKLLSRLDTMRRHKPYGWVGRILKSNVTIDRKLCKKPVMVLPYGGTLATIEEGLREHILEQKPVERMWKTCETMDETGQIISDDTAVSGGYLAFTDRDLEAHPLFKHDVHELAVALWDCIRETIPKALAAMEALRKLGKFIKQDALTWECNYGQDPLRVVHAYPKSASHQLKLRGLHMGGEIRGLKINSGRDEVDPYKHITGIVANFIHSQDATHLARTMEYFERSGGGSFGAVHDCYMFRATDWDILRQATRQAFVTHYGKSQYRAGRLYHTGGHPLECPVELQDIKTGLLKRFDTWLDMAGHFGVSFPDFGSFEVEQVLESAWFFS